MREILFRGKRIDNGKWIKGFYYERLNPFTEDGHPVKYFIADVPPFANEIHQETIGQFTGLFDKNGAKIFEGDIIEFGSRNLVVWWDQEKFQWRAKAVLDTPTSPYEYFRDKEWDDIDLGWIYAELPSIGKTTTTIIGNIHDNPEMLNV